MESINKDEVKNFLVLLGEIDRESSRFLPQLVNVIKNTDPEKIPELVKKESEVNIETLDMLEETLNDLIRPPSPSNLPVPTKLINRA